MLLKNFLGLCFLLLILTSLLSDEKEPRAMIWLSPGSPPGVWEHVVPGDAYPADLIMKTIADMGFTDVLWQANWLRGGAAAYPTKVEFMQHDPAYKGRDILEETLVAADKYNLRIWPAITPGYQQPGTDIKGMNNPRMVKIYTDLIEELGRDYKPRHKSLYGIMAHEFNCVECMDMHEDDVKEFSDFCEREFGEKYNSDKIPAINGTDVWNRRFFLYKADVMNKFNQALVDNCAKYGLKYIFCLYVPETNKSSSARWGYEIPAIEKYSNNMWTGFKDGYYNSLKEPFVEASISYKGQNLPMNFVNSFHGCPISVFEVRSWLFPEAMRAHYSKHKEFTKISGDFYNGHYGRSEKVVELFQKKEYVKPLIFLLKSWQGAESKARVGLLSSSMPFVMRYGAPGIQHEEYVKKTLAEMKKHFPAEIILVDSEKALDSNWIEHYKVIVIPPETGRFLSPQMYNILKGFLAKGGKLVSLGGRVSTSKKDLTCEADRTKELFGVDPAAADLPPLTRNDNAFYLNIKQDETGYAMFCNTINELAEQPVLLKDNSGFTVSSAIVKDNVSCIALPAPSAASALLCVNADILGLDGDSFNVKELMTGTVVAKDVDRARLKQGISIKTKYDSQPFVLAVGKAPELERFSGIYRNVDVFSGMDNVDVTENPEVGFEIPDRPGKKIGIYSNSYGAEDIMKTLDANKAFNCFFLPRLDSECLRSCDMVIIPQPRNMFFFQNAYKILGPVVANGKVLVMTHSASPCVAQIFKMFKGIGAQKIIQEKEIKVKTNDGQEFSPGFASDNYVFSNISNFETLAVDEEKRPVIISAKYGKGRVLLFGTLPGCLSKVGNPELRKNEKMPEAEAGIFLKFIEKFAGDKK